jgi:hypothetical protein
MHSDASVARFASCLSLLQVIDSPTQAEAEATFQLTAAGINDPSE